MERPRTTNFERCAVMAGLLTQEQLLGVRTALGNGAGIEAEDRPFEQQLADKLVELGHLNVWQAKQLLDGRTKFTLGPYQIVDSLGRGGMGQVFKGEHNLLGRIVAIKVLPLSKATPEAIASFAREIRNQASLDHENLVRALDADTDGNVYYLVTEYVPGSDLKKLVRRVGALSMTDAASVISQVAAGLQHAHERGIVHRDVKPGNVLVTPEWHAKLSDLGLAGPLTGGEENDPRFGKIVGTADYLSPDHIKTPWEPTPAWDIYSLGCTLYLAVTGKVPFPHGNTSDKARAHCELLPPDPRRLAPNLEAPFVEVIADMMAKDPAERIPTATEVIARLAPWTNSRSGAAERSTSGKRRGGTVWSNGSSSAGSDSPDPDDSLLRDTEAAFPEFQESLRSQVPPGASKPGPDGWQANGAPPVIGPAGASPSAPTTPASMTGPLLVLVALPVAVLGLVLLVRWLTS